MSEPAGVIHDIGYRSYDGPRLGHVYAVRSLWVHNLRAAYGLGRSAKTKVTPFLLFATMTLPALGYVVAMAVSKESDFLVDYSMWGPSAQVLVAIFLATQAPVLASRDLRFHVVPLYFSRPLRVTDYVLAKYGAMVTALLIFLVTPLVLLFAGVMAVRGSLPAAERPDVSEQTLDFLGALGGSVVLALLLAGLGLVIAAYVPRRGLGVTAVIAVYLISSATVGVIQETALKEKNNNAAGWAGLGEPFSLADGVQVWAFGAKTAYQQGPPGHAGGPVFALVCAALTLGCLALLLARFRKAGNK